MNSQGPTEAVARPAGWTGKRTFDIAAAGLLLLATLPLFLLLAVGVKVSSRGPIFFRHRRVGMGGREFEMFKFRSMVPDSLQRLESDPHLRRIYLDWDHKVPARLDPRITRFGRFLRAASLDELPQILNVLRGDMSMVGPRPVVASELDRYRDLRDAYLAVRPGITGLWQVSGRCQVPYPRRAELDHLYVTTCRPRLDLKILLSTPLAVVRAAADA